MNKRALLIKKKKFAKKNKEKEKQWSCVYHFAREARMLKQGLLQAEFNYFRIESCAAAHSYDNVTAEFL